MVQIERKNDGNIHSVKSLSHTRWPSSYDAVRSLKNNCNEIRAVLSGISECDRQKTAKIHKSKSLIKKLDSLEAVLMTVIWEEIEVLYFILFCIKFSYLFFFFLPPIP
jgi:hypothetical protein